MTEKEIKADVAKTIENEVKGWSKDKWAWYATGAILAKYDLTPNPEPKPFPKVMEHNTGIYVYLVKTGHGIVIIDEDGIFGTGHLSNTWKKGDLKDTDNKYQSNPYIKFLNRFIELGKQEGAKK